MTDSPRRSRQTTSDLFRTRTKEIIARSGLSHAEFARRAGLNNSTLAQLLSSDSTRLPRSETLIALANACRVSVDWLLGLSQQEEMSAELVESVMRIEPYERDPMDHVFLRLARANAGAHIRQVSLNIGGAFKTETILRHEYRHAFRDDPRRAMQFVNERQSVLVDSERPVELCSSIQSYHELALGQGLWRGLSAQHRLEQLDRIETRYDERYPTLKVYLFDLFETYSIPFSLFGVSVAALFLGPSYLLLNAPQHVRALSRRFDELIRLAVIQPDEFPNFIQALKAEVQSCAQE
ncbi:MAG: helix-turn-helix transcriptional regulator [Alphaproteobacteria bacterium]|uniref:helix-turn-helix domain-containing protein n=1 Tax=Marinobacter salarius TaxID=1420917 RepID=UPI0032EF21BE